MLKFDILLLNLTSGTLLENGCLQNLSIMTNFESLVCRQTEIEVITVCHFHSELFFEFEQCVEQAHIAALLQNSSSILTMIVYFG